LRFQPFCQFKFGGVSSAIFAGENVKNLISIVLNQKSISSYLSPIIKIIEGAGTIVEIAPAVVGGFARLPSGRAYASLREVETYPSSLGMRSIQGQLQIAADGTASIDGPAMVRLDRLSSARCLESHKERLVFLPLFVRPAAASTRLTQRAA
jgi:hypothetical protein